MRLEFPGAQPTAHGPPNTVTPGYSTATFLHVISAWTQEEEKIIMNMGLQAKQGCGSLPSPPLSLCLLSPCSKFPSPRYLLLSQDCTRFPAPVAHTHIGQGQKTPGQCVSLPYLGLSPPWSRLGLPMDRTSPLSGPTARKMPRIDIWREVSLWPLDNLSPFRSLTLGSYSGECVCEK